MTLLRVVVAEAYAQDVTVAVAVSEVGIMNAKRCTRRWLTRWCSPHPARAAAVPGGGPTHVESFSQSSIRSASRTQGSGIESSPEQSQPIIGLTYRVPAHPLHRNPELAQPTSRRGTATFQNGGVAESRAGVSRSGE